MVDPHMPLLTEIQALRARLGPNDPADWRDWRCPPSPCLTSILLAHERSAIGGRSELLSILDQLVQLSTTPPDPDQLRTAALLDGWSVRRMDDSCLHLIGDVTGHATITDGTGIFTAPYLRLDRAAEWAGTRHAYYRLGRHDRQRDDFNRAFHDARGTISTVLDLEN